jgi:PAS domain S-box-containing protein
MHQQYYSARILIIDDDEDDYIITSEYVRSISGNSFVTDWCGNYNEALSLLKKNAYDIYFVDYRLGARSGVDLLKEALSLGIEEPIVLLTGKGNYDVDIESMRLGAVDYLIKPEMTTEKMERCIRYALDRTRTMKALKANEHKYRSIFEKSKDVIFITDHQLRFKEINSAVEAILGFSPEELKGRDLLSLVDHKDTRAFINTWLARHKELNDHETVFNTKQGEKIYCILTLTPEEDNDANGNIQGIIHDITSLKRAEKAALQSEKLAAAGRLVRTIAHEVRNPLNNITLAIEQMHHDTGDGQQQYMDIIQRNSSRINGLISELLNTSRPAENTLTRCVLQHVIDDVIASAVDRLTLKHIKLQVNYPTESVAILADKEKLALALMNIVINAVEAMEEKKGVLTFSLHEADALAILTIRDNGCGISDEHISRLFEPYFTQKRNGVGLGLTFTLNIIQAHKAAIEVTSEVGSGTSFMISFPIVA